jgi:hypothetical protein
MSNVPVLLSMVRHRMTSEHRQPHENKIQDGFPKTRICRVVFGRRKTPQNQATRIVSLNSRLQKDKWLITVVRSSHPHSSSGGRVAKAIARTPLTAFCTTSRTIEHSKSMDQLFLTDILVVMRLLGMPQIATKLLPAHKLGVDYSVLQKIP